MKGILKIEKGCVSVDTEKGNFSLHKSSFGRHLKEYKGGEEVEVTLATEGCPFDYTARCTSGRCDCDTYLYAVLKGLYV